MSDLNSDIWDENDYMLKDTKNLAFLMKNNLKLINALSFDFIDYKANEQVPCLPYHRVRLF